MDPQVGSLQVIDVPGSNKKVTVDEFINDGPTVFYRNVETEEEKIKEKELTFGQAVSAEFSLQMKRSAGIELKAISAGAELTTTLTTKAEATASQAFKKSDRIRDQIQDKYTIDPYMHWSLTTERSVKNVRQDVFVTGALDFSVRFNSSRLCMADYESFDDILGYFRRTKPGGSWFGDRIRESKTGAEAIEEMEKGVIVTVNCPIKGTRARYSRLISKQTPISR